MMERGVHRTRTSLMALAMTIATPGVVHAAPSGQSAAASPEQAKSEQGSTQQAGGGQADIVVTATRRARPLSQVPVAVSVIDAEALRNSGASDIRQLNQLSPSLLVSSTGSEANAVARIRGIGTVGDNPGLESSVALFIDGVYRPRTGAGLTELGAVERIELLRGPQGTLFGRNASAGLIAIVTRAPELTFDASGEAGYGNYNQWRLAGRVTGPLTDRIAVSIETVHVRRDGLMRMVGPGGVDLGDTNDRNRQLVRGQMLIRPDDRFSLRLIADYTQRDEHCCAAAYRDTGEETGANLSTATPSATNRIVTLLSKVGGEFPNGASPYAQAPFERRASVTPGRPYVSRVRDWGLSAEANYSADERLKLTSITGWRSYKSADYGDYDYSSADILYRDPGTYRRFTNLSQEFRAQGKVLGGALDWLVGGYYAHEELVLRDNIRFGADYGRFAACRLLGGTGTTPSALLGLAPNCVTPVGLAGLGTQLVNGGFPAGLVPVLSGGLTTLAGIGSGGGTAGDTDSRYRQKSDSFALFTHNIIRLSPRLDLTLGLRHTWESKRLNATLANDNAACLTLQRRGSGAADDLVDIATLADANGRALFGNAAALAGGILTLGCLGNASPAIDALALQDRMHSGEFSGTAALSWRPTDRLMVYASFARGYKAGGYNLDRFELGNRGVGAAVSPVSFFTPRSNSDAASLGFSPETANAYELGVKLNHRRFSANIAAFRQEFSEFQLNSFNGTSFIVQNISGCGGTPTATAPCPKRKPGLVSQGVEAELSVTPTPTLLLTGGVTYTDARYAERLAGSPDGSVPLDPALFLLPGGRMSNAPRLVTTASIGWTPPIGTAGLSALLYVDGRRTSSYNTGSDLYPEKMQDGYLLMNARLGLRGRDQRWAVEFWCQNLLDTDYRQLDFNSPLQGSGPNNQTAAQLGRGGTVMTNQLYSAYLGEPRTYGLTLRWTM
ncbi:TonB-dependent receptor [Sphingobium sufflavum]|nr:TonB-dependent receptor [Sphingobium sufflavum]